MAKQTINIGASPNDGTGTPLRTAFDYTNQNFTELYTATGPSGNNIVVPGSATITGDLTVDTSTLKVDSTNNRVGIGTASPTAKLQLAITGSASAITRVNSFGNDGTFGFPSLSANSTGAFFGMGVDQNSPSAGFGFFREATGWNTALAFYTNGQTGGPNIDTITERYRIDSSGVATWSNVGGVAGTAMTLNSTGLGVGISPQARIHAYSASGSASMYLHNGTAVTGKTWYLNSFSDGNLYVGIPTVIDAITVTPAGNVGIGVTPSAWTTYYALQVRNGSIANYSPTQDLRISSNAYYASGVWKRIAAAYATQYLQDGSSGIHQWFVAATGNVDSTITTFSSAAMTLDASGNLLVGKTGNNGTVGNGIINQADGAIWSTMAASTSASNTLLVYSTGAAAYRFYVNLAGTVFATNTTISAISDARFKENVQDIDVGLGAILALKPRKFDWKEGKGKNIKGDRGFIAQEFEQVFPNLVDEWKDEAPEGEAPYKSVRQDLIPVLVKAIQELTARVQTLETR